MTHVLHIGPAIQVRDALLQAGNGSEVEVMRRAAESAKVYLTECPDIYRGLARLCRLPHDTFHAVAVCLDELHGGELAFFGLVRHKRPGLRVEVYTTLHQEEKVREAIRAGATCRLDAGLIVRLLSDVAPAEQPAPAEAVFETGEWPQAREESRPAPQPPTAVEEGDAVMPAPPADSVEDRQPEPEPNLHEPIDPGDPDDELDEDEDAGEPAPARVPWLHYRDRPARTPPVRTPPPNSGSPRDVAPPPATPRSEPQDHERGNTPSVPRRQGPSAEPATGRSSPGNGSLTPGGTAVPGRDAPAEDRCGVDEGDEDLLSPQYENEPEEAEDPLDPHGPLLTPEELEALIGFRDPDRDNERSR